MRLLMTRLPRQGTGGGYGAACVADLHRLPQGTRCSLGASEVDGSEDLLPGGSLERLSDVQ
jgi:hypothetical protein